MNAINAFIPDRSNFVKVDGNPPFEPTTAGEIALQHCNLIEREQFREMCISDQFNFAIQKYEETKEIEC